MVHLFCKDHGALYVDEHSGRGDLIQASNMKPLLKGLPRPMAGEMIRCPLCKGSIEFVFSSALDLGSARTS